MSLGFFPQVLNVKKVSVQRYRYIDVPWSYDSKNHTLFMCYKTMIEKLFCLLYRLQRQER